MSFFSFRFNNMINDIFDETNRFNYGEITKERLEESIKDYFDFYSPIEEEFQDLLVAYRNEPEIIKILNAARQQ